MKLKNFDRFINENFDNFFKNTNINLKSQIERWCKEMGIINYKIVENKKYKYIININNDVNLSNKNLTKIPYKFGIVNGKFDISNNNLESLENSPDECYEFNCSNNSNLKFLIGGPKKVKYYYCDNCNLISLEGAPEECESFSCSENPNLKSLINGPKIVTKFYNCSDNPKLKSLIGAPQNVNNFYCENCGIETLEGSPQKVEIFSCEENKNLKSLIGGPKKVIEYYCRNCDLISLEGAPEEIEYKFVCSNNPKLKNLIGGPKKVDEYYCMDCGLESLEGAPEECEVFICSGNPSKFTIKEVKQYIKNIKIIEV